MALATIPEAIADIKAGKFLIIVDDEGRENEGDLAIAAEKVTPEAINFMAKYGRGLICIAMTGEQAGQIEYPDDGSGQYLEVLQPLHCVG